MPSEPLLGQLMIFGGNFSPRGWAFCQGQLLSIAQNTALFSLLGTTYGGDGQVTFALPDLRGRVPIHHGQGPGLANRTLGEMAGTESVTLIQTQMPAHAHAGGSGALAVNLPATSTDPTGRVFAVPLDGANAYSGTVGGQLAGGVNISPDGGNQPHDNVQPFLCLNYCIALEGIFPSRN
jgi:microcystin-dependent protein